MSASRRCRDRWIPRCEQRELWWQWVYRIYTVLGDKSYNAIQRFNNHIEIASSVVWYRFTTMHLNCSEGRRVEKCHLFLTEELNSTSSSTQERSSRFIFLLRIHRRSLEVAQCHLSLTRFLLIVRGPRVHIFLRSLAGDATNY